MDGGKLDGDAVAKELESPDAALKETAWWIVGRHAEWERNWPGSSSVWKAATCQRASARS
jgi:hypothetical protein